MRNLFIIGSPRSGTTFLASLLEPTPYGAPFETQFILKYYNKLESYGNINNFDNLEKLLKDISAERAIAQWQVHLDAANFKNELKDGFTYKDVVDLIGLKLMSTRGRSLWGDKTPHYILKLDELIQLFPDAKFLYIVRDGRDVALSLLQKPWGPNTAYTAAKDWHAANNETQQHLIQELNDKGQLILIKYEDLVENTEQECTRIYSFLDDNIENYREKVDSLILKTISGNYAKWPKKMTKKQILAYESVAKDTLALHGYPIINQDAKISIFKKLFYQFQHQLSYVKFMFIQNVIDTLKIKFLGKQPFDQ